MVVSIYSKSKKYHWNESKSQLLDFFSASPLVSVLHMVDRGNGKKTQSETAVFSYRETIFDSHSTIKVFTAIRNNSCVPEKERSELNTTSLSLPTNRPC